MLILPLTLSIFLYSSEHPFVFKVSIVFCLLIKRLSFISIVVKLELKGQLKGEKRSGQKSILEFVSV